MLDTHSLLTSPEFWARESAGLKSRLPLYCTKYGHFLAAAQSPEQLAAVFVASGRRTFLGKVGETWKAGLERPAVGVGGLVTLFHTPQESQEMLFAPSSIIMDLVTSCTLRAHFSFRVPPAPRQQVI